MVVPATEVVPRRTAVVCEAVCPPVVVTGVVDTALEFVEEDVAEVVVVVGVIVVEVVVDMVVVVVVVDSSSTAVADEAIMPFWSSNTFMSKVTVPPACSGGIALRLYPTVFSTSRTPSADEGPTKYSCSAVASTSIPVCPTLKT